MPTVPHRLPLLWEIGIAIGLCALATGFETLMRWPVLIGCLAIVAATRIDDRRYRIITTASGWLMPAIWLFANSEVVNAKGALIVVTIFLSLLNGIRVALAPREVRTPISHRFFDLGYYAAMAELSGGGTEMWILLSGGAIVPAMSLFTHFRDMRMIANG